MRSLLARLTALAAALLVWLILATSALAVPTVTGVFKATSAIGQNTKIVAGPDGNVWFTIESATNDVAKITPAGVITEYELPKIENPTGIANGPNGRLWVAANQKATSFLPKEPKGTEETFESNLIQAEPNIVEGPEGLMWVASNNKVAHFSPTATLGSFKEVPLTGELSAKDIDVAGSLIVIADSSTTNKRIVTFTSAGVQKDIPLTGGSQGVAGAPSGQFAFSQQTTTPEQLGLVTPPGAPLLTTLNEDPFGVAFGPDGAFWFVRSAKDGLARLSSTGVVSLVAGLPAGSMPRQIAAGPGNTLWVTIPNNMESAVARISGVEAPPPTFVTPAPGPIPAPPMPPKLPQTTLGKKPKKVVQTTTAKASVKFGFSSSIAGAQFECSLGHRVKPKGKKARFVGQKYGGCKSPKSYQLAPGRYRFGVRAVSGALRDSSPATFGFKVVRIQKQH